MKIIPKSAPVTSKALRQQIASLRDNLTNETAIVERLSKENCELLMEVTKLRRDVFALKYEVTQANIAARYEQARQAQAHETIALLVQKMPAAK